MTLSQLPGLGTRGLWALVRKLGSPGAVLASSPGQRRCSDGRKRDYEKSFSKIEVVRESCLKQLEDLQKRGGRCLTFEESDYPDLLRNIIDPPPVLYILGDEKILNSSSLAVVGSRSASQYGLQTSFSLSRDIAAGGVTIVSGLALGIDSEAHRGALQSGGKTVAVLGCGIDVIYPRQNGKLYKLIEQNGVLVSEYPLGTRPEPFRFPARNRIISGLSNGVLVVEAAKKSGSLITAQLGLDEGREVYAVPGQIDSFKSEGTHWLIQQGAKLVQSSYDVLQDFDETNYSSANSPNIGDSSGEHQFEGSARLLYENLDVYSQPRDLVLAKSGLDISEFSEALLLLELEGVVRILPGDEICLIR